MTRQTRALIACHVVLDLLLGMASFALAYLIRFNLGVFEITKGLPPFTQYLVLMPFVGLLVVLAFHLTGAYRLHRHRTSVDDFFNVLVGTLMAVVAGLLGTLYVQVYTASPEARDAGTFEVSRLVWGLFVMLNVGLTHASRDVVRRYMRRRFAAGAGLRRVLIAGTGELARHVVDSFLRHAEFGYRVVGFIDDAAADDHLGYRGLPLLGKLADARDVVTRERIDELYVALPLEQHVTMLRLIEVANRECVDVKVVPGLLQFVTLRARLEELDGLPLINVNDIPLQGLNSAIKRLIDICCASAALAVLGLPMAAIAAIIRLTSPGPALYRQERMGLDGRSFTTLKFRSMFEDAERNTGPVWTRKDDPRCTPVGRVLRRFSLDELPQLWNVLRGEMSLVGPRPERPYFVEQFKDRVPEYMLRHKVKAGLTGWAQVNDLRGNTSIEQRIEYDLYYIENWSVALDFKIMWLTVLRLSFHRHAY